MSLTSALQPTKAETAVLASEILEQRFEELPSVSERTIGKPKSPIAMVSTQVLSARLHGKASNDVNNHVFGAAHAEDCVLRCSSNGNKDLTLRLSGSTVKTCCGSNMNDSKLHPRAILFDGEFTAIDHRDFAPRSQTQRRYGVASKDVRPSLESPLAVWLRYHWQNTTSQMSSQRRGHMATDAVRLMQASRWSRAATLFTIDVCSVNEFYLVLCRRRSTCWDVPLTG